MNTKTLIATATAAALLPMSAFAVGVAVDGGTTNISSGSEPEYIFLVDPNSNVGGDAFYEHTFILDDDGNGSAAVTINSTLASFFTGLVAEWINDADGTALASVNIVPDVATTLATTFSDPGTLSQTLRISWASVDKDALPFDGSVTVSTVPVPAGLLLMGTALAGLGLTRRKA